MKHELQFGSIGVRHSVPIVNLTNTVSLALGVFSKLSHQNETVILMYHSIDSIDDFHAVHPEQFRHQIEYLRKNYAIVSLNEIVEFVKYGRNLPRKTVAITFDDGLDDFYSNVYPYFREAKFPATIFVTTGYVGKKFPFGETHQKMLTWKKIEEMSENNIEIGAHTVTHPDLQHISLAQAKHEILKSKLDIESHINRNVNYFSYPFGSYKTEIVNAVKSSGFKAAVGEGGTIQRTSGIFILNRVQVDSSVSFMFFKVRLTRAVDWLRKLERMSKKILRKSSSGHDFDGHYN
jgi:peptidoglycan/xylan/chitin deacetylase (PgdA/CDA1 family)